MAQVTYTRSIDIGYISEQLISFEVTYDLDASNGDIIIDTYYAAAILFDSNNWRSYEKVPDWLHKLLEADVEDYKYDMLP